MAKPYPDYIALKNRKCPRCGAQDFGHPDLVARDAAVHAACKSERCDYKLDLFWIGDRSEAWNN